MGSSIREENEFIIKLKIKALYFLLWFLYPNLEFFVISTERGTSDEKSINNEIPLHASFGMTN
tara:strand:+ start:761 stop:949 length:189 start_codon:yes stop_codon:yes gene_type:complete